MLLCLSVLWTASRLFKCRSVLLSTAFAAFALLTFPPVILLFVVYGAFVRYIKPLI